MSAMEVEDLGGKEEAAKAKALGTNSFRLGTVEGYNEALGAYMQAAKHDPTDHVHQSNICAAHLELTKKEWHEAKKVECAARALIAATECTKLSPSWVKGHARRATAEFELVNAYAKWAVEKKQKTWDDKPEHQPGQDDPALKPVFEGASFATCEASCRAGLALEPANAGLRLQLQALRDAQYVTDEKADLALQDVAAAAAMKAEGNAAFSAKRFADAAEKYTAALAQNPLDHIFYSNRSACYAEVDEPEKALRDAERCIALAPATFAKGHSRASAALFGLGRYVDSEAAAKRGLAIDPESAALKELLATAQLETAETPDVQMSMHEMRSQRKKDEKLKSVLSGLNLGNNVQMFGGGGGGGGIPGLEGLFGGGGGGMNFNGGNGGGLGGPAKTDDQMRQMARAMGKAKAGGAFNVAGEKAPAVNVE